MSNVWDAATRTFTDGNGNEAFGYAATASAVNYPNLVNSATGTAVRVDAIGDDTNLSLELRPKGTGTVIAQANVADANVIGGIPVIHRIDVAAGATGDVDVVLTHKTRVIDAWLVKRNGAGGGGGTITVKNGSTAITDDLSIDVADKAIVRATTIDDAQHEISGGGTLKITRTRTASSDETCVVYVTGIRVA